MPRPVQSGRRYVAGLDGIRAVAVLCVIAFHVGLPWARGGMLGVGVFFTLSGYLITDLLLAHWRRHGSLGLGTFWLRRARRLLPGLFLMLVAVSVYVALFDASQLAGVRRQVLAAVGYFGNWSTIADHGSYFARFAAPLPLDHLWSLAIEEQFYLVWPGLVFLGIWAVRSRMGLAVLILLGAVASALAMGLLYHRGYDPTRVYEGTDTRAFGLLVGCALAIAWPSGQIPRAAARPAARDLLDAAGVAGLIGVFVLVWRTTALSSFLYPAGFALLTVCTAAVVAAVVNPGSRLGAALGWSPLRWLGVRSYGIYLWQWPIIVLANPSQGSIGWARAILVVAGTLVIAGLSWRYVEEPIRQGALGRLWHQVRSGAGRFAVRRQAVVASGIAAAFLAISAVSLGGLLPVASAGVHVAGGKLRTLPKTVGTPTATTVRTAAPATTSTATRTACRSVIYIGDSTSEGETSTDYIPNPRHRLQAQLADVGVRTTIAEISGARSIVETYQGQPNAATVAKEHISQGFNGCWILALGANEVDDVNTGSSVGLPERISRMMGIVGRQPVLWVNAITLLQNGPYADSGMQRWNADLLSACFRYPTMRVVDWRSQAEQKWFIPDGIHYYSPGYVARTHLISRVLAAAFPATGPPPGSCLVR